MIKPQRGELLIELKEQSQFKLRRSGLRHYEKQVVPMELYVKPINEIY